MHKIKELLHKDSEDSTALNNNNNAAGTEKHGLFHHGASHDNNGGHLSNRQFEQGHITHGEIEHGGLLQQQQQHFHASNLNNSNERHIVHEREVLKDGGGLYRAGYDPALNREVASTSSHTGGVTREIIDEGKIVKETIKEVELHKVQPVIHRDREQREIRHVVEPHKKFEVRDTKIDHREREIDLGVRREASTLETSRSLGSAPRIESSREFLGTDRQHQELPTRVEEHVHRKVEEHVHPVIYKEVLKPKVTEETHHIYETVQEAPIETYEVKTLSRDMGDNSNMLRAEREFLDRESSRGMVLGEGHSCSRDIGFNNNNSNLGSYSGSQWQQSSSSNWSSGTQQFIGNQGNRGLNQNSAYDAALCNQCTDNPICSHSVKDAARMEKMNEKKILKDDKLAQKQARMGNQTNYNNVNVV